MDATTFDRIVAVSASMPTRRAALTVLTGSVMALVHGQGAATAKKGKGKSKGKGKGKPKGCKSNQKMCDGKCIPDTHCCTSKDCVYCVGEACLGDGTCRCLVGTTQYNGVCGFKPNCLPVPNIGGPGPSACCSGNAVIGRYDGIEKWVCMPGTDKCLSDFDCTTGTSGRCKGYMCPELYNWVTADYGCP